MAQQQLQKQQQQLKQQQQQLAQQQLLAQQQQPLSQAQLQVVQTTGGGMEIFSRQSAGDTGTFGNNTTPARDGGVEFVEGIELHGAGDHLPGQGEFEDQYM